MDLNSILLSIIADEICDKKISMPDKLQIEENLEALYALASKHDLAHAVAEWLSKHETLQRNVVSSIYKKAALTAYTRSVRMEAVLKELIQFFEENRIPFLPLKGAVLRQYYPEPWLRTSCDIDILIQEADLDRVTELLIHDHGFLRAQKVERHDVSLYHPSGVHLELHFSLLDHAFFKKTRKKGSVFTCIWDYVVLKPGTKYQYEMPDEWFYLYHIAHMAKHFAFGGCGIRLVLDTWILNNRVDFDWTKRESLLSKVGLLPFERTIYRLSEMWFHDGDKDEILEQVQMYILNSGIYGTKSNANVNKRIYAGGKKRYLFQKFVLPYNELACRFPVLKKNKWLTPVFQVLRWIRILFVIGISQCFRSLSKEKVYSPSEYIEMTALLERVGLLQPKNTAVKKRRKIFEPSKD